MKRKILNVMPECYVDTNLIEYLLDGVVNHQHCCSKVVGQLNNTFADKFAIGIIDKDKVELGYIQACDEIAKTEHLTLLKHKSRHQYLITISPAVDKFVLDSAKEQGVDTEKYNLPSTLKDSPNYPSQSRQTRMSASRTYSQQLTATLNSER